MNNFVSRFADLDSTDSFPSKTQLIRIDRWHLI